MGIRVSDLGFRVQGFGVYEYQTQDLNCRLENVAKPSHDVLHLLDALALVDDFLHKECPISRRKRHVLDVSNMEPQQIEQGYGVYYSLFMIGSPKNTSGN